MIKRRIATIQVSRSLSPALHELVLDRGDFRFTAGDEILVHGHVPEHDRAYSIASGEGDDFIRILFRIIPEGIMSPRLALKKPGDTLSFSGPMGSFHLRNAMKPVTFMATGTGIAPALSFIQTHPALQTRIIHGVRKACDLVYAEWLGNIPYIPCVSGDHFDGYTGRVTDWLRHNRIPEDHDVYLCGANEMIEDARSGLIHSGHTTANMFSEPYYFW